MKKHHAAKSKQMKRLVPISVVAGLAVVTTLVISSNSPQASAPLFYTTLDNATSVSAPANGAGAGAVIQTTPANDFVTGQTGNGIRIDAAGEYVRFQETDSTIQNVELDAGTVEFLYKPNYAHTDGVFHNIFAIGDPNLTGRFRLFKAGSGMGNELRFELRDAVGTWRYTNVPSTKYSWSGGQWVKVRVTWNGQAASGAQNIRIYFDDIEKGYGTVSTGPFSMPAESSVQYIYIGAGSSNTTANASGVIDEFKIFAGAIPPQDTTPPSTPAGLTATPASASQINLSWNAAADNVGVLGYVVYRDAAQIASVSLTTYQDTGLQASTTYTYTVAAYDAAGNTSPQSSPVAATTTGGTDTAPPAVSVTAPQNGAVVGGTVALTANATDNVGVIGVKFYVDGVQQGAEDVSTPYAVLWLTTSTSNANHLITAVARDAAGNSTTSPAVISEVYNQKVSDITYCTGGSVVLKMDAYYPARTSPKPMPVAVFIHGGGWTGGDKKDLFYTAPITELSELNSRGYLVTSINYRLAPTYKFPAFVEDTKCAIRHLRANAAFYGIDAKKIGAFGPSAGGYLAAMLGATDLSANLEGSGGYPSESSRVQAVVDYYGPTDLTIASDWTGASGQRVIDAFGAAAGSGAPQLTTGSPVTHLTSDDPPFLIIHGTLDTTVVPHQSQVLYDRLVQALVPAELVWVQNAGHNNLKSLNGQPTVPTREQVTLTVADFFDTYLK